MDKIIKRWLSSKTVFSKMMVSFVIIIFVLSIVYLCARIAYMSKMKAEMLSVTSEHFNDSVFIFDQYLDQMKYTFAEMSMDPVLSPVIENELKPKFDYSNIIDKIRNCVYIRKQNEFVPYLKALFIVTPKFNDTVIDSSATYRPNSYFSFRLKSEKYSNEFWLKQMQKDNVFQMYPVGEFRNVNDASLEQKGLMPITYKLPSNNNFIIVSLFDIDAALQQIVNDKKLRIYIYNKEGTPLYPSGNALDPHQISFAENQNIKKTDTGYVFKKEVTSNGLVYYCTVSNKILFNDIYISSYYMLLLYLVALVISLYIAFILSSYFNKQTKKIALNIKESGYGNEENDSDSMASIEYIDDGVQSLIAQNDAYLSAIDQKDSLLKAIFLQSRMRDIYVSIDDVEKQLNISQCYIMIYMRANYTDAFYKNVQEERGKSTFFLKQLIELYLSTSKVDATTFQIENDQIVSVIHVEPDYDGIMNVVNNIIKKLENESEYVFFTIVVSKKRDNISKLKSIYDQLYGLSKYAMPVKETQVLVEGEVKQGAGHFYFTVEQMEKLSALMQNEPLEDCIRNFNEILDYNIKKEVNGFDLYLLCTEIINCGVKLVNRLFHTTPPSIGISEVYDQLDKAVTLEQYKKICEQLIERIVEYIRINKRDEDYIISFILDYVENHYAEDIYLNLFAEKLKLTAAYISSYFKEKMNVNLSDYINNYRIKKAIVLIENPQNKNKDIAAMVGLQNINTFIRLFKKYTGYTPGEYKKKHFSE